MLCCSSSPKNPLNTHFSISYFLLRFLPFLHSFFFDFFSSFFPSSVSFLSLAFFLPFFNESFFRLNLHEQMIQVWSLDLSLMLNDYFYLKSVTSGIVSIWNQEMEDDWLWRIRWKEITRNRSIRVEVDAEKMISKVYRMVKLWRRWGQQTKFEADAENDGEAVEKWRQIFSF